MVSKVELARKFAEVSHVGQWRKFGGEKYIVHPVAVAELVSEYTSDEDVIAAALLHDVVEDCGVSIEEIESLFGSRVAELVLAVTKVSVRSDGVRAVRRSLDHHHFASGCADAQLIKAMDSLHNASNLGDATDSFRTMYVKEKRELAGMLVLAPKKAVADLLEVCEKFDY